MTSDEPLPPIEYNPPYSVEFVAHLHGGCYPNDITARLLAEVRADDDGRRMVDQLAIVLRELRLAGRSTAVDGHGRARH